MTEPTEPAGDLSSLAETNLTLDRAAGLFALADGLCRVGRIRDGKEAGQFSVFNFLLRAAYEEASGGAESRRSLVVLMRAGVVRRHTWFARVFWREGDVPMRIEVPSSLDHRWEWWLDVDEIRKRLIDEPVWLQAVGASWEERVAAVAEEIAGADLIKVEAGAEKQG